jgi:branched-chain amino acid transport system substrate-binding protein
MKGIALRTNRFGIAASVAAVAVLGLSSCTTTKEKDTATGDVCGKNLAFMGALTGDAGTLGLYAVGGVKLALDDYNAKHPDCKIGLKKFDSQSDEKQAPAIATKIVGDSSIIGLVGPLFSGESLASGKTFNAAGLPSISPGATNVTITQQGWKTWHRVIGNDSLQGAADAKYLKTKAKKVFVISDEQDYSTGLAGQVKKGLGDAFAGEDQIRKGDTDFSATVTKVKASGADAVFYAGYYTEAGLLAKVLHQGAFKGVFMSGDGSETSDFVKIAGAEAANGAVLSAPAGPPPADFAARFKKANDGSPAGLYSTQGYDAANIFLAAFDAGKKSPEDINAFIDDYSIDNGASGPIKFDEKGDVTQSTIYAYFVRDGKLDETKPEAIK